MKYDVIIIGGGIAGVTAAIYLKRGMKNILLLESKAIGGQIITSPNVENYPGYKSVSGVELGTNMFNQIKELDIPYKFEEVLSIDGSDNNFIVNTNNDKYECKKVIIATGANPKRLRIEDEYIGKGVSFCATCDGNFFKNKDVAVIGGGNTALDDSIYLSNICNKVYLIHRRDTFRGEESKVELLKNKDNVEFVLNANVVNINGDNKVESIDVNQNENMININISGLFICIGRKPNSELFNVNKDDSGYIITDENMETNVEGLYAIGDVRSKEVRQLTTASSDGTIVTSHIFKKI